MKKYITDEIGEKYKEWGAGDKVFITAPTGTGKTHFILNILLPYAAKYNKCILLIVNRKILVEQLLKDLEHIDNEYRRKGEYSIKKYIRIVTYQNIETYYINSKEGHPWLGGADFIVCDEAHYFLNDALFNTNTYRSYILINQQTQRVPIIFISATMSIEKEIMFNIDWQSRISVYNKPDSYSPIFNSKSYMENKYNKYVYERERNYNYLDIKAFSNVEQIPDIVCNEKNGKKWLIFINHIEKGKEIANRIKARERDAVFIDSQYTADEESLGAVKVIAEEEIMNHDIIIATSALDNGISIKDLALRSMIIVAETEMELIQMLGRKREDGKRLKLYLCLRSKRDFSERLVYYRKLQSVYDTCQNYLQYNNIAGLIEKLMNDIEFYLMARRCLILENNNGCVLHFSLNPFSNAQIANYIYEYEKIIKAFEEDSHYAFLNEQLSWLGYSREKVEEVVCLTKGEEIQALKKEIEIIIESYLNIPLDKTQKDKMKNEEIKEPLMRLIKLLSDKDENKSLVEAIRKTDRGFSVDKFNEAMKITELMYYAENSSDKKFVIKRKM